MASDKTHGALTQKEDDQPDYVLEEIAFSPYHRRGYNIVWFGATNLLYDVMSRTLFEIRCTTCNAASYNLTQHLMRVQIQQSAIVHRQ